jgi:WhiB family redox-sensing transcriptional regulator
VSFHDHLRELAANLAYPDAGTCDWAAPYRPALPREPPPIPDWSVEFCAEYLRVEPCGVEQWWRLAACRGMDTDLFFPERGDSTTEVRNTCSGCSTRAECLAYAFNNGEKTGVWGGLSERKRRAIRRSRTTPPPIQHGTNRGYGQHLRRGDEDACRPCLDAHRAHDVAKARRDRGLRP